MKSTRLLITLGLSVFLFGCATQDATTHKISQASQQQGANQDWPSFGRDYANKRFSENAQINRDNVKDLTAAWQYKSGVKAAFQATP
ncbi:MAG: pyrrolo-quinoline quinone, partial [Methylophilaceae bacterium]|nr:pyrrolo-quinoline quinone [Methylophilaceae bacterium]